MMAADNHPAGRTMKPLFEVSLISRLELTRLTQMQLWNVQTSSSQGNHR